MILIRERAAPPPSPFLPLQFSVVFVFCSFYSQFRFSDLTSAFDSVHFTVLLCHTLSLNTNFMYTKYYNKYIYKYEYYVSESL